MGPNWPGLIFFNTFRFYIRMNELFYLRCFLVLIWIYWIYFFDEISFFMSSNDFELMDEMLIECFWSIDKTLLMSITHTYPSFFFTTGIELIIDVFLSF